MFQRTMPVVAVALSLALSTYTLNLDDVDLSLDGGVLPELGSVSKMGVDHPDLQCALARIKALSAVKAAEPGGAGMAEHYLLEGAIAGITQRALNGQLYTHDEGGTVFSDRTNATTLPDSLSIDLPSPPGQVAKNYTAESRNPIVLNLDSESLSAAKAAGRIAFCLELAGILLHEMMHTLQDSSQDALRYHIEIIEHHIEWVVDMYATFSSEDQDKYMDLVESLMDARRDWIADIQARIDERDGEN